MAEDRLHLPFHGSTGKEFEKIAPSLHVTKIELRFRYPLFSPSLNPPWRKVGKWYSIFVYHAYVFVDVDISLEYQYDIIGRKWYYRGLGFWSDANEYNAKMNAGR